MNRGGQQPGLAVRTERLRAILADRGLTHAELADRLRVTRAAVSQKMLPGARMSLALADAYASLLKVHPSDIVDGFPKDLARRWQPRPKK